MCRFSLQRGTNQLQQRLLRARHLPFWLWGVWLYVGRFIGNSWISLNTPSNRKFTALFLQNSLIFSHTHLRAHLRMSSVFQATHWSANKIFVLVDFSVYLEYETFYANLQMLFFLKDWLKFTQTFNARLIYIIKMGQIGHWGNFARFVSFFRQPWLFNSFYKLPLGYLKLKLSGTDTGKCAAPHFL